MATFVFGFSRGPRVWRIRNGSMKTRRSGYFTLKGRIGSAMSGRGAGIVWQRATPLICICIAQRAPNSRTPSATARSNEVRRGESARQSLRAQARALIDNSRVDLPEDQFFLPASAQPVDKIEILAIQRH